MSKAKKIESHSKLLLALDETHDIIVENQRGIKLLGIPFFSSSLLLPGVDPPNYQLIISVENKKNRVTTKDKQIIAMPYHGPHNSKNITSIFDEIYPLPWIPKEKYIFVENNDQPANVFIPEGNQKQGKWYVRLNHNPTEKDSLLNFCDGQGWIYSWRFRNKHWKDCNGFVRRRIWVYIKDTDTSTKK